MTIIMYVNRNHNSSIYTHRSSMAKLDQHQFLLITLTGSALSKVHDGEPICTKPGAETEAATWNSAIIHFIVYTCSLTTVKKRIKHVEENSQIVVKIIQVKRHNVEKHHFVKSFD